MTKYIIGTIADIDTPLTPSAKGSRSRSAFIVGDNFENVQRQRDEILSTDVSDIRKLSEYLDNMQKKVNICVIGGEELIAKDGTQFDKKSPLCKGV